MLVDEIHSDRSEISSNFTRITYVARFTVFWSGMAMAAIGPLLPEIRTLYHVGVVEVSWVYTLLLLGSVVALTILPRLSDTIGDRFAMTLIPTLMALGLGLASSGSFVGLLVGAFALGMGGAATPIVVAAMRRTLPGESTVRAINIAIGSVLLGTGVGYFAGGLIEGHLSLREYFVVTGVVSAALAVVVYRVFPQAPAADSGSLGLLSVALLITWVVAILFAISKGREWGWLDVKTLGMIGGGIAIAIFWARREAVVETPAFDVTLLRSSQFRRTLVGAMTLGLGGSAFTMLFPMLAEIKGAGFGPSATLLETGLIMLPYSLVGIAGSAVTARLAPRRGGLFAAGIGAMGHCCGALSVAFFHETLWQLAIGAAVYGIGIGMLNAGLFSSIQSVVGRAQAGMANSALGITTTLAASVGPIIYSTILAKQSVPGLPGVPAEHQFVIAFFVNASVDLFCAVICFSSLRQTAKHRVIT